MKKFIYAILAAVTIISCNDYLDIKPKGEVIPSNLKDYDELLNGGGYTVHTVENETVLALTADNFEMDEQSVGDPADLKNNIYQLYTWGANRFADPNANVNTWNNAYQNIYVFNKVIEEVMSAAPSVGYNETDRLSYLAQAKYGRALDYLFLVNTFSKHYKKETANSDYGVPLVLKADITQKTPDRGTVQQVYDQIIKDLTEAIPNLPVKSTNKSRPNKGSGYALLARTYLYQSNYEKAAENATLALQQNNVLQDYITGSMFTVYALEQYSFRYFGGTAGFYNGTFSDGLLNLYNKNNDIRYYKYFLDWYGDGKLRLAFFGQKNASVSVPEMYITRAESYARTNKTALALQDLNTLRDKRIIGNVALTTADFATNTALVKFCLEERRRELVLNYCRLFDLKRENLEPAFAKTVVHPLGNQTFTAEPNSNKLVLPIPAQVLKFNPNMPQN